MLNLWKTTRAEKIGTAEARDLGRELEQRIDRAARQRIMGMLATFEALEPGWQKRLDNGAGFVMEAGKIRASIRAARQGHAAPDPPGLRVQVSSLFLKDCRDFLIADPDGCERLVLISGTISDSGVRVFSRMIHVPTAEASPAYVRADPVASHRAIVQLVERDGHPLVAMFHSHIMHGAESTRPSGVDIAHQERFCAIGCDEMLGGIFSLDGYVRLFNTRLDFTVSLYGTGATIITDRPREKIIKLTDGA